MLHQFTLDDLFVVGIRWVIIPKDNRKTSQPPLAERVRPRNLSEVIGQKHLVSVGQPLSRIVETGQIFSMILWGPPGSGKTTLARLMAKEIQADFVEYSAVDAKKAQILDLIHQSRQSNQLQETIIFIDELHRFNKAQQGAFLPYVENGMIILIGATTENPSFEVIGPLLSRCRIFVLNQLSDQELRSVVQRGARELVLTLSNEALDYLARFANGDARQALNLLESTHRLYREVTLANLEKSAQSRSLRYDKKGEDHYNLISALIKSMRASKTDASLYYVARLIEAGEDPLFIARRMVIFASEDIGQAMPTALVVANEVFRACETIGYPECAINLAHGAIYLSQATKSRAGYEAYLAALEDVRGSGNLEVPLSLRNAPTGLMKDLGYGQGYEFYSQGDLLPDKLKGRRYYREK